MTDADICRRKGWSVGTVIEGPGPGYDYQYRKRITAIGEVCILMRILARKDFYRGPWRRPRFYGCTEGGSLYDLCSGRWTVVSEEDSVAANASKDEQVQPA